MASAMTDWGTGQFLGMCMGIITPPSNFYAALCSAEPGEDIDGTALIDFEPDTSLNYSRVTIPSGASYWSDPSDTNYSANINPIVFPTPTGTWGEMNHFALCSLATNGQVYLYGEFDSAPFLDSSTPFSIPAGGLVIGFGNFAPSIVGS